MRVMIVCGGTGGHIYPGVALAQAIAGKDKNNIIFIGRKNSLEEQIFLKGSWTYRTISISGMPRKISLKWISFLLKLFYSIIQAIFIIMKEKPDVIVGTGAYISVPIILAGKLFGKPEIILEQNIYPGLASRTLGHMVNCITISFEETIKYLPKGKCILTGNPVRPEIISRTRKDACAALNLDINKKTILIFGGSQGAHKINTTCIEMKNILESFSDKIQLILITGDNDFKEVATAYENIKLKTLVAPFLYNMEDALAAADLVISRSGATTLAEITVKGLPSILIPYPYATDDHQTKNARFLVNTGAAYLMQDIDLDGYKLGNILKELLFDENKIKVMQSASLKLGKPNAINDIKKIVEETAKI
ncbi:undecaprenyldiphospho-muramoylpentapeptide beta-N-acetylglucosaminyltransferase [Candidatus Poribacteria bacterium]|nr:undecaprenyldiphospho-muramoylpentapeptide beta-N-acetylglucosaminyltransferase [Candidatus Poribacteria bacterium]